MGKIYIKIFIKDKNLEIIEEKNNIFLKILFKILYIILPKGNPDFEDKIDLVESWLLEFENKNSTPIREIGFDIHENIIMKMPYGDNIGYLTDSNMTLDDVIQTFEYQEITKKEFNTAWNKFGY